jgi:hypothetical protein
MTVSTDGTMVCTDPGVGILAPGWHAPLPGAVVEDGDIVTAKKEDGSDNAPGTESESQLPPACPLWWDLCGKLKKISSLKDSVFDSIHSAVSALEDYIRGNPGEIGRAHV